MIEKINYKYKLIFIVNCVKSFIFICLNEIITYLPCFARTSVTSTYINSGSRKYDQCLFGIKSSTWSSMQPFFFLILVILLIPSMTRTQKCFYSKCDFELWLIVKKHLCIWGGGYSNYCSYPGYSFHIVQRINVLSIYQF